MPKISNNTKTKKKAKSPLKSSPTVVWGSEVEAEDFVKVPRTVLRLARYIDVDLKPRHMVLLLALASRKFQKHRIRAYWEELADDLGVNKNTVRKWAYELKDLKVLRIVQHRGRDPERDRVGVRNDRNEFDLSPYIEICKKAYGIRKNDRERVSGAEV